MIGCVMIYHLFRIINYILFICRFVIHQSIHLFFYTFICDRCKFCIYTLTHTEEWNPFCVFVLAEENTRQVSKGHWLWGESDECMNYVKTLLLFLFLQNVFPPLGVCGHFTMTYSMRGLFPFFHRHSDRSTTEDAASCYFCALVPVDLTDSQHVWLCVNV